MCHFGFSSLLIALSPHQPLHIKTTRRLNSREGLRVSGNRQRSYSDPENAMGWSYDCRAMNAMLVFLLGASLVVFAHPTKNDASSDNGNEVSPEHYNRLSGPEELQAETERDLVAAGNDVIHDVIEESPTSSRIRRAASGKTRSGKRRGKICGHKSGNSERDTRRWILCLIRRQQRSDKSEVTVRNLISLPSCQRF